MARTGWRKTDLSVYVTLDDGTRSYAYTMGSGDRRTLAFDAEEDVDTATATMTDLETGDAVASGVVENVVIVANDDPAPGDSAHVTVAEPPGDATYILAVTFTLPDSEQRTRTLFVDVPV